MNNIYYWKFFAQPIAASFSIAASIFCQMIVDICNLFCIVSPFFGNEHFSMYFLQGNWPSGYGSAIISYTQLLFLCYMGSSLTTLVCDVPSIFHLAHNMVFISLWTGICIHILSPYNYSMIDWSEAFTMFHGIFNHPKMRNWSAIHCSVHKVVRTSK